ncbi:MAG: flagellar hook capping FlgD N-terminal domain-containing protein [Candidatus Brocadiia bacterium]
MDIGSAASAAMDADSGFYMNLLLAQLQNQNPMEPMSNTEMMTQMAQLASLDGIRELNDSFQSMLQLHRLASGTGLIGRQVEYRSDSEVRQGTVEAVSTRDDRIEITVDGEAVPLEQIRKIL